jgi:polar amino acid transport system substrate-binding protein
MKTRTIQLCLVFLLACQITCYGAEPVHEQVHELRVAVGLRLAPYVLETSVGGVEYEYVSAIMSQLGYTLHPHFMSLDLIVDEVRSGRADMALTIKPEMVPGMAVSHPYVTYRNAAINLASRNLTIDTMQDLKHYSVAAFANAKLYLGPEFAATVAGKQDYQEYANQLAQNAALYKSEVDVVVMDVNIFSYLDASITHAKIATIAPVSLHEIFPANQYCIAFRDPAIRDLFDKQLAHAKSLPEYKTIKERWQARIAQPLDSVLLGGK